MKEVLFEVSEMKEMGGFGGALRYVPVTEQGLSGELRLIKKPVLGGTAKNLALAIAGLAGDDLLVFQFGKSVSEEFKAAFRVSVVAAMEDLRF